MISIVDEIYSNDMIQPGDLFVCVFGYEERSYALFQDFVKKIQLEDILVLSFDDVILPVEAKRNADYWKNTYKELHCQNAKYYDHVELEEILVTWLKEKNIENEDIRVHIDYSSMPRNWYCRLPTLLETIFKEHDKAFFWYVEGEYDDNYEDFPSAGIESFVLFSGKPSLRADVKRTHVIALSYDKIRTQAIVSLLDPDSFVVCDAYDSRNRAIHDNVIKINSHTRSQANMSVSLHIDNFSFMLSKLCEVANELLPICDVIFVPDGPKPLVFAISLVPKFVEKEGVTCLHMTDNKQLFAQSDIKPTDRIVGFSVCKK